MENVAEDTNEIFSDEVGVIRVDNIGTDKR
jgi:hypothetical protein